MVFSSMTFLFGFLPVLLACYFLLPQRFRRGRNGVLLAFSLLFYAWGGLRLLGLMAVSIAVNYCGGLLAAPGRRFRRGAMWGTVAVNLALLGWFKYAGFLAENLALLGLPVEAPEVTLPIGISFFTFQGMSYVLDVYRGEAPAERAPLRVALYIALFPQLVAGPIVRYTTVAEEIASRRETAGDAAAGGIRFCVGLAKKMLLANALGQVADAAFRSRTVLSTAMAWLGALAYTGQIYFDFSGYSDMAIGLGELFGFHFPENFNYPYLAASVTEFWRRWHMTLSGWFREYLYIPLGGSRRGTARTLANLLLVFLVTGLWHGASWQFVAWGAWYGLLLAAERLFLLKGLRRLPAALGRLYTLFWAMGGWVLFRAPGLRAAAGWLRAMLLPAAGSGAWPALRYLDGRMALLLAAGLLLCGPLQAALPRLKTALYTREAPGPAQAAALLAALAWCLVLLVCGTYNPFIYFRF